MRKYVFRFFMLTLAIIVVTGCYIWLTDMRSVSTLAYVPDPTWSQSHTISPHFNTLIFKTAVDGRGNVHMAWINYNSDTGMGSLVHSVANPSGKVIHKPKSVTESAKFGEIAMTIEQDTVSIFYATQGKTDRLDLNYISLDTSGTVLAKQTVLANAFGSDTLEDLKSVREPNGGFLLVWGDELNGGVQLQSLAVDAEGKALGQPVQLTSSELECRQPNLLVDQKGRYHLTWYENTRPSSAYYAQLDGMGKFVTKPLYLGRVSLQPIAIAVVDDNLYLVWNQIMKQVQGINFQSIIEKTFRNYEILGVRLNLNQLPETVEPNRLTSKNGPSFDQAIIADNKGQIQMVYVDTYTKALALTHQVYTGNFEVQKEARRIYPDQLTGIRTTLMADQAGGIHLIWLESGKIHYANTIKHRITSPLQVIGINENTFGVSLFMSLVYILCMPIFGMLLCMHVVLILILMFLYKWLYKRFKLKQKLGLLGDRYFVTALFSLIFIAFYIVFVSLSAILWPAFNVGQVWFIFLVATLGVIAYLFWNKFEQGEIGQFSAATLIWIYWLIMVNSMFHIPFLNF